MRTPKLKVASQPRTPGGRADGLTVELGLYIVCTEAEDSPRPDGDELLIGVVHIPLADTQRCGHVGRMHKENLGERVLERAAQLWLRVVERAASLDLTVLDGCDEVGVALVGNRLLSVCQVQPLASP